MERRSMQHIEKPLLIPLLIWIQIINRVSNPRMPPLLKLSHSSPDRNTDSHNRHNRQIIHILQHQSHKEGQDPNIDDSRGNNRIIKVTVRIQITKTDRMADRVMLYNVFAAED